MKLINYLRGKIHWHLFPLPKDSKILSVYELVAYVGVFVIFCWLFYKIHDVPYHKDEISIDLIHLANDDQFNQPFADITYHIPNSYTFEKNEGKGMVNILAYMKRCSLIEDSAIVNQPTDYDILFPNSRRFNYEPNKDSLLLFYLSEFPDSLNQDKLPTVFHIVFSQDNSLNKQTYFFVKQYWKKEGKKDSLFALSRMNKEGGKYVGECYMPNYVPVNVGDKISSGPLSRPCWYSLYDISQSYYMVTINGDIEGGKLSFYFDGVADFSDMYPEPDLKTMNSVHFFDKNKILEIKQRGLEFHVKFPELENTQNVRLFFVSAAMSALFALFITFCIIGTYKLFNSREE